MVAIWYLVMLAPVIALPILWWNYRNKVRQQETNSGARWDQLTTAAKTDLAADRPATAPAAAPALAASATVGVAPVATKLPYAVRVRALDPAETLVYFLLRSALPEHAVMPRVALAHVLEVPAALTGLPREQPERELRQQVVDFLICDKAMRPVTVIDLRAAPAMPDFKTRCLAQAGIRYLQFARTALPKRDSVRRLVLGG